MGSLTHSRRPNGRDTPHHIRCLSCRSGFFDDLLPTAVPGLDTNADGTLCSIVPSVSGHPRRRGTGPGPPGARAEYLAGLSYRDRESRWNEALTTDHLATGIFIAETAGGDVVGFADGGPEREGNRTYLGELYAIYVLQEHQNRGLGRHFVSAVAQRLLDDGFSSTLVWVLEDNRRACRFYESLGGEWVGGKTVAIGGADLEEVSYGWRDIADLVVGPQI